MSLEAAVEALVIALNANTAALNGRSGIPPATLDPRSGGPIRDDLKPPLKTNTNAKPALLKPAPEEVKAPPPPAATYDQCKKAFLDLMKKIQRDPAIALIAPLVAPATTLKELEAAEKHPGQYAAIHAALSSALAK